MSELAQKIHALLFYRQDALSVRGLAKFCSAGTEEIRAALEEIKETLAGQGVQLLFHDEKAQLVTARSQSDFIKEVAKEEVNTNLTSAQSEALAIIAYLAPVNKIRIDFIRGVNSRAVLRNLSARGLVQESTKDAKKTYTLTNDALAHLGVNALAELPDYQETRKKLLEFTSSDEVKEQLEELS